MTCIRSHSWYYIQDGSKVCAVHFGAVLLFSVINRYREISKHQIYVRFFSEHVYSEVYGNIIYPIANVQNRTPIPPTQSIWRVPQVALT